MLVVSVPLAKSCVTFTVTESSPDSVLFIQLYSIPKAFFANWALRACLVSKAVLTCSLRNLFVHLFISGRKEQVRPFAELSDVGVFTRRVRHPSVLTLKHRGSTFLGNQSQEE